MGALSTTAPGNVRVFSTALSGTSYDTDNTPVDVVSLAAPPALVGGQGFFVSFGFTITNTTGVNQQVNLNTFLSDSDGNDFNLFAGTGIGGLILPSTASFYDLFFQASFILDTEATPVALISSLMVVSLDHGVAGYTYGTDSTISRPSSVSNPVGNLDYLVSPVVVRCQSQFVNASANLSVDATNIGAVLQTIGIGA